jgi:hypothetical protein
MIASRSVGPRSETYSCGIGTSSSPVTVIFPSHALNDNHEVAFRFERVGTVFRPSHLEATGHPLDPLHAEARSEPTATNVIDEVTDRTSECLPLLVSEGAEVPQEALGDRISRHD